MMRDVSDFSSITLIIPSAKVKKTEVLSLESLA